MPTISMFFGILIRMYYTPQEHNTPHIHVYYQDDTVTFGIENGEILNARSKICYNG